MTYQESYNFMKAGQRLESYLKNAAKESRIVCEDDYDNKVSAIMSYHHHIDEMIQELEEMKDSINI